MLDCIGISQLDLHSSTYADHVVRGLFVIDHGISRLYIGNFYNNYTIHSTLLGVNKILARHDMFIESIDHIVPHILYYRELADYQKSLIEMYNACYPVSYRSILPKDFSEHIRNIA
jgi:hypothetical protein